jgi:hypothetical protein
VAPRPDGSNDCPTITDWVQVGRFAAVLDIAACPCEFQKADCAPRSSLGNGVISITDWVQAGRYAAAVDSCTPAGGPVCPGGKASFKASGFAVRRGDPPAEKATAGLTVRLLDATIERGQSGTVSVEFDSEGNENALGFSVSFDTSELAFVSAAKGSGAGAATLQVNSNEAGNGRVGLALALGVTESFPAGTHEIVVITFDAAAGVSEATTAVTFGDDPILREISDPDANPLSASYVDGQVTFGMAPTMTPTVTVTPTEPYSGSTGIGDHLWRVYR